MRLALFRHMLLAHCVGGMRRRRVSYSFTAGDDDPSHGSLTAFVSHIPERKATTKEKIRKKEGKKTPERAFIHLKARGLLSQPQILSASSALFYFETSLLFCLSTV